MFVCCEPVEEFGRFRSSLIREGRTMEIIDVHIHQGDLRDARQVSAWLESMQITGAHVFSTFPRRTSDGGRSAIETLMAVAKELPGRIIPLAWIDPIADDAIQVARWAVKDKGVLGFKMIPNGWYPDDPRAKDVYKLAEDLSVPIQFHSGILWQAGDTSKYNRPAFYEALWDFPGVRFALAHIGWPWTDECIAVVQKFKVLNARDDSRDDHQAWIDLTPGTPGIYRRDALERCLACVGAEFMMYGSDGGVRDSDGPQIRWKRDVDLLPELGCSQEDLENIFAANARKFLTRG